MRLKADLTLLLIAVLWGSAFAAQRVAGLAGGLFVFNSARFILAALILIPFIKKPRINREEAFWMCAAGIILFIASAFQQAGILTTSAGNAGFITSLYVVLVPVLLFAGWREKPHWLAIVAVLLAGLGAFLLSTAGRFEIFIGDSLELAGALFWAFHVILLGKVAVKFDFIRFASGQFIVTGILNGLVGLWLEDPAKIVSTSMIGAILYTAVFSIGLGYTLQVWAQRYTPPTDAALILSLEAVFAVLAGRLLLKESLSPVQLLGCGLILFAVLLSQVKEKRFR